MDPGPSWSRSGSDGPRVLPLAPHVPAIAPGASRIEPAFGFVAVLRATDGSRLDLDDVLNVVVDWLTDKFPEPLPEDVRHGAPFARTLVAQSLRIVSAPPDPAGEPAFWSMRLVQPDAPTSERRAIPGRTWITELSLLRNNGSIRMAMRVRCASLPYATAPVHLVRPRVLVDLAQRFVVEQVRPLTSTPWFIESDADISDLFDLVTTTERRIPVFVLTEIDPDRTLVPFDPYVLDPVRLAHRARMLAHVVVLPRQATYEWTGLVGKVWSCFLGAVRTYWPGIDMDHDDPTAHPLAFPDRIRCFRFRGDAGEEAFERYLVARALEHAARRRFDPRGVPMFDEASQRAADLRRQAEGEPADAAAVLRRQLDERDQRIAGLEREITEWMEELERHEKELRRLRAERTALVARIDSLSQRLRALETDADTGPARPGAWDDVPRWASEALAGHLVLHPRAQRALKNARYENLDLVLDCLELLAGPFRDMMTGVAGARERYEARREELGVEVSGSITRGRAGEEGDAYFVVWPLESQRRVFLEQHVKKGTGFDERRCLRIYFFWDAESQQVVVGWLPSHLRNRMT